MTTSRLLAILALGSLFAAAAAAAEEVFAELNFALRPPEGAGWELHAGPAPAPPKLLQTGFVNRETGRSIQVHVLRADPLEDLRDESFIEGVEKGLRKSAPSLRRGSRVYRDFAGVPALEARFVGTAGDTTISFLVVTLLADGRRYSLSATAPGEGPELDAELDAALAGFRFLEPPSTEEHGETFRIGYVIGYYVLPIVLVVGLLALLRSRRRRRSPT